MTLQARIDDIEAGGINLPLLWDGSSEAGEVVLLAHGAGAGMRSDFMEHVARRVASKGLLACRFEFPYMHKGRKAPDRQDALVAVYRSVVEVLRGAFKGPLFVGGKSLGGRIASHVAASGVRVDGVFFLGYPLHPPGRPERMRDAHLRDIPVPMLFVEGTRDPFCPLQTLHRALAGIEAETTVVVIDDGDHSLKVRRSSGRTTAQAWDEAGDAVVEWIKHRLSGRR